MTTDNMKIWDAVEKTDPAHTKTVNQRGGFTAIGANYQIMRATQQFGPIGIGWGYMSGDPVFHDTFVLIPVTLWHGDRENTFGPAYGCCEMLGKRPDSDAPKKAGTDGLTKLLSQLGFNADVFMGKFDDNKYLAEVTAEFEKAKAPPFDAYGFCAKILDSIKGKADMDSLNALWNHKDVKANLAKLSAEKQNELSFAYDQRVFQLS